MAIFQSSEHQRERSTQLFRGLLNIGSELIHFQETPNANVTSLLEWRPEEVRISLALIHIIAEPMWPFPWHLSAELRWMYLAALRNMSIS